MLPSLNLYSEVFRYQFIEGSQYRILAENHQNVYLNNEYIYSAQILNKIQVEILEESQNKQSDNLHSKSAGRESVHYQRSEELLQGESDAYRLAWEDSAEFWIDELGYYDIAMQYFVPSVRNVPVFPEQNLEQGDSWSELGEEIFDFRESFALEEPVAITVPVNYTYFGEVIEEGKTLQRIHIEYFFDHWTDFFGLRQPYPYRIRGVSSQILYFDNTIGRSHSYTEEYEIILNTSDGDEIRYTGNAEARVIESSNFDKSAVENEIRRQLSILDIDDSSVQSDDRGVTISLENIQFPPDSADLRPEERSKLDKIAQILRSYPNRDILVSGHTALAGSAEGRQILSEERARVVVDYLLSTGVRQPSEIFYQGFAAERPIADNANEAGKRRNRRVEITILEN